MTANKNVYLMGYATEAKKDVLKITVCCNPQPEYTNTTYNKCCSHKMSYWSL